MSRSLYLWLFLGLLVLAHDVRADAAAEEEEEEEEEDDIEDDPLDSTRFASIVVETEHQLGAGAPWSKRGQQLVVRVPLPGAVAASGQKLRPEVSVSAPVKFAGADAKAFQALVEGGGRYSVRARAGSARCVVRSPNGPVGAPHEAAALAAAPSAAQAVAFVCSQQAYGRASM